MSLARPEPPELIELEALGRKYAGLAHQVRVEGLARRLRQHHVAVHRCRVLSGGRKLVLTLAEGSRLTLDLFWPQRAPLSTLEAVDWQVGVGWDVTSCLADGSIAHVWAWRARLAYGAPND